MKKNNFLKLLSLPLLLSLYPVLALLAITLTEVDLNATFRAIVVSMVTSLVLYFLLSWILKDSQKASIVTAVFILFFYSYGHIYTFSKNLFVFEFQLGRHRFMVPLWIALISFSIYWLNKNTSNVDQIIEKSDTPPIIIIQGDHGGPKVSPENRIKKLIAFYLPEGESILYPNTTLVNSFRVIFNHYFQGEFELQSDISYSLNLTDLQGSKGVEENNPACLP